jgi:hypothetical protein
MADVGLFRSFVNNRGYVFPLNAGASSEFHPADAKVSPRLVSAMTCVIRTGSKRMGGKELRLDGLIPFGSAATIKDRETGLPAGKLRQ